MNFKAWDNKGATYGFTIRLLLVLKVRGRLWIRSTSGSGDSAIKRKFPHAPGVAQPAIDFGLWLVPHWLADSEMKEGCSGENVLERER